MQHSSVLGSLVALQAEPFHTLPDRPLLFAVTPICPRSFLHGILGTWSASLQPSSCHQMKDQKSPRLPLPNSWCPRDTHSPKCPTKKAHIQPHFFSYSHKILWLTPMSRKMPICLITFKENLEERIKLNREIVLMAVGIPLLGAYFYRMWYSSNFIEICLLNSQWPCNAGDIILN